MAKETKTLIGNCKIGATLLAEVGDSNRTEVLTVIGVKPLIVKKRNCSSLILRNKRGQEFKMYVNNIHPSYHFQSIAVQPKHALRYIIGAL